MNSVSKILSFPNADQMALSIRAKAQVFSDPRSLQLLELIEKVAACDATVLIIGETGTGKELVARHIHERSGRSGPFVAVNCGAFSETLVESELFGHVAGAFTGAQQARAGWFEAANHGTLFLDEVGDLSLSIQVKLLRVLQERQVTRIGSCKAIPLDVRLIAATNVDLGKAVQAKHFRLDLYYRLNVAPLQLPPLRERCGDIMPLVRHFIDLYRRKLSLGEIELTADAEQALMAYCWPGNIRELENVIHFALILCRNATIGLGDLRLPGAPARGQIVDRAVVQECGTTLERLEEILEQLLRDGAESLYETVERLLVTTAFAHCRDNQVQSAKSLGISRNILRAQLKRFGVLDPGSRPVALESDQLLHS
jgi:sigma-54-specific transcriptional regulator